MRGFSWVWLAVGATGWHAQTAQIRAVENGVAVLRPTRKGISLFTDHQGRLLGYKADYFVADEQTLIAALSIRGATTVHPGIGDVFAYAAAIAFAVLIGVAVRRGRALRSASAVPSGNLGSSRGHGPRVPDRAATVV
jgi:apolipoprotein N-acyltransferase